ncbi:winged helix-turn-helix domain-containing protein [Haloarcula amylovorans]|uniref:winged helix-turn-helix domain-containing protein n=1 Tax=Haloarcula amylovorans TaxID=2562280 RepID=UPI0010760863|nr:helix-turn-helix domain-containing protein [Halomicroarcula amylolytica]
MLDQTKNKMAAALLLGMSERKRAESGEYTREYSDDDILQLLPEDGSPVTIPEILETSDIPRSTLNYHLNRLVEVGKVEKRKPSANVVLWSQID